MAFGREFWVFRYQQLCFPNGGFTSRTFLLIPYDMFSIEGLMLAQAVISPLGFDSSHCRKASESRGRIG
jgi:hypothetical protein